MSIRFVQALHPGNTEQKVASFVRISCPCRGKNPHFLSDVMFTDECKFTNSDMFNHHNEHVRSTENPYEYVDGTSSTGMAETFARAIRLQVAFNQLDRLWRPRAPRMSSHDGRPVDELVHEFECRELSVLVPSRCAKVT
ncbi:uncharacterized protein [Euwallacea fornicatus]|uniref:uncharacterized protein n=1 Tax=Euwallacea fornicatus TaxID=995702 RepID=UPI00338FE73B